MATIHISATEAARDFANLLARARAGAEIVIEGDASPDVVLRAAVAPRRSISEAIALAKKHEGESGKVPVLDPEFAADVDAIIRSREPWNPPTWE